MIRSCSKWKQGGKTEPSMGFEPTTPCDLASCSNHCTTGDSMVQGWKGEIKSKFCYLLGSLHLISRPLPTRTPTDEEFFPEPLRKLFLPRVPLIKLTIILRSPQKWYCFYSVPLRKCGYVIYPLKCDYDDVTLYFHTFIRRFYTVCSMTIGIKNCLRQEVWIPLDNLEIT